MRVLESAEFGALSAIDAGVFRRELQLQSEQILYTLARRGNAAPEALGGSAARPPSRLRRTHRPTNHDGEEIGRVPLDVLH
jgi:hypothetical protein